MNINTQDPEKCKPIIIGERPLRRGEIIRLHFEIYRGRWTFHLRRWFHDDSGELCPGKGFACAPDQLPWLAAVVGDALSAAREHGLITDSQERVDPLSELQRRKDNPNPEFVSGLPFPETGPR